MAAEPESFRLADLLAAASSLASFRGEATISMDHLRLALAVCRGEATIESFGPGLSPLIPRRSAPEPDARVRAFAQRWNARLGDPYRLLSATEIDDLSRDLAP